MHFYMDSLCANPLYDKCSPAALISCANIFCCVLQTDIRDYSAVLAVCEGADCVFHVASYGMSGTEQVSPHRFGFFCVTGVRAFDAVTLHDRFHLFILPWSFGKLFCANWSATCKQAACSDFLSLRGLPAPWEGVWDANGIESSETLWRQNEGQGRLVPSKTLILP